MRSAKREPVDRQKRRAGQERRFEAFIEALLRVRTSDLPASDEEIRRYRREGRP